ncbi:hypothetical protein GCK32_005145 [Trichostrongylus colubriformis]|uniref:Ras-associating domain-containing protein n=1 Tax=Trichostrongylus colubriformis TaxID=6319 RepID=A0AAN8G4A1_TRICO
MISFLAAVSPNHDHSSDVDELSAKTDVTKKPVPTPHPASKASPWKKQKDSARPWKKQKDSIARLAGKYRRRIVWTRAKDRSVKRRKKNSGLGETQRHMHQLYLTDKERHTKGTPTNDSEPNSRRSVCAMSDAFPACSSGSDKVDMHLSTRRPLLARQTDHEVSSFDSDVSTKSEVIPNHLSEESCWKNRKHDITRLSEEVAKYRRSLVWTRVFSINDEALTKGKNGVKRLVNGASKLLKNATRGVHLASIIYKDGKILCTNDDCIPTLSVDEDVTTISSGNHQWLLKTSWCWEYASALIGSNPNNYDNSECLAFRSKLMNAVLSMRSLLGLDNIGHLHHVPVIHGETIFLITVRFLDFDHHVQGYNLKWSPFEKLLSRKGNSLAQTGLARDAEHITNFYRNSRMTFRRGLYLCYMKLSCSLNAIHVAVPSSSPSFLPFVLVRDDPNVTKEEWQYIEATDIDRGFAASTSQAKFRKDISSAIYTLFHNLDIDSDIVQGHRLYHAEILKPSDDISVILVLPRPADVCSAPSGLSEIAQPLLHKNCETLPIAAFEIIHQSTYQPEFFTMYCRLSIFLEHYLMVCQYQLRNCLLENDVRVYKTLHEDICKFQEKLDKIWNESRWISRIATEAREKHVSSTSTVPLNKILAPNNRLSNVSSQEKKSFKTEKIGVPTTSSEESRVPSERLLQQNPAELSLYQRGSIEFGDIADNTHSPDSSHSKDQPTTNEIISVYTAYDCDLHDGAPIHLTIQKNTTSLEVVRLVLERVPRVSPSSKDTFEAANESSNFCLVVVVGTRERRLKDDFVLCRIQSPWNKGRLYVRRRSALLAAVRYGNEAVV